MYVGTIHGFCLDLLKEEVFAAADGALQDRGLYPSSPGRTGLKLYARTHPWIVAGAVCGVVGVVLSA